jgi:hypothetical protein
LGRAAEPGSKAQNTFKVSYMLIQNSKRGVCIYVLYIYYCGNYIIYIYYCGNYIYIYIILLYVIFMSILKSCVCLHVCCVMFFFFRVVLYVCEFAWFHPQKRVIRPRIEWEPYQFNIHLVGVTI